MALRTRFGDDMVRSLHHQREATVSDGSTSRDADRSRVYAAEDQWTALLDRGGQVDFFGSTLDVRPQLRFGSLEAMESYVAQLVDRHTTSAVRVRHRRGRAKAHYVDGVIAIPADANWACRQSVLLHEFAHHLAGAEHGHDRRFRSVMISLVDGELGPEAALLLRAGYQAQGLGCDVD